MVNTGQPSKACVQCRARRVKCDQRRPSCQNCSRLGIQCPGYTSRPNLTFKDDTKTTQRRAQRIYQALDRRENSRTTRSVSLSSTEANVTHSRRHSISPADSFSFTPTFDAVSLTFFAHQITTGCISTLIGELYGERITLYVHNLTYAASVYPSCSSALKATIELLATSILTNSPTNKTTNVASAAIVMYGRAIKEVNEAVQNVSEENFEQTLLTVEVLAIAELCSRVHNESVDEMNGRTRAHLNGMTALAGQRGSALFATEIGRRLFHDVFLSHLMFYSPLSNPQRWPLPADAIDILLQCSFTPQLPEYTLLPLLQRSLDLRVTAVDMFSAKSLPARLTIQILKETAEQLRTDLEDWWRDLPTIRKLNKQPIEQLPLNIYDVQVIFVEDTRIKCYQMLKILGAADDAYRDEIAKSVKTAQRAVESICDRLPYTSTEQDLAPTDSTMSPSIVGTLAAITHSMVQDISDEQHQDIEFAREACARASKLSEPSRSLPRTLISLK